MKIPFFDKHIRQQYWKICAAITGVLSAIFLFFEPPTRCKHILGLATLIALIVAYLALWLHEKYCRSRVSLKVNNSEVVVKFGDIFTEQATFRAIAANEYFDTQVDDIIVARSTLHGKFIENHYIDRVHELDALIESDPHLVASRIAETPDRPIGKKHRHKLGTVLVAKDHLLVALSRFDENNRAHLEINEYINALLHFWNEVDRIYAGQTVALSVLGSGITRFRGYENISDQELLELIIWTFKVSRVKFTYPSLVKIVVHKEKRDRVNLLDLKDLSK